MKWNPTEEERAALSKQTVKWQPTEDERTALIKIFGVAEGFGGGARRARSLLCAWWNGAELGGFDFADLWSFDEDNLHAALTVINMIGRAPSGTYASDIDGFEVRMRHLAERRAKEVQSSEG